MTDNRKSDKSQILQHRMLLFAANVIRELPKHSAIPKSLANQLTRSSASVGANYAEACNAASKADFRNKIFIAKKEAAESRYWIDLCAELTSSDPWFSHRTESQELLMILQAIINSMKEKSAT